MSGLAAILHRDSRPIAQTELDEMIACVPYRGPDGMVSRSWGAVGLAHARLIVTPEDEHEQQPLTSPRSGCAIVADVRLDNREDLLRQLIGTTPYAIGDAEIILRAYEAWGIDAVPRLVGDFAFVIWDPQRHCLLCARDTEGQRTLFYRSSDSTFAAASEIHQLLQDPSIPIEPDDERIRDFFVPINTYRNPKDVPATLFAGIRSVPAGHLLVVDNERLTAKRYWKLDPKELRYRDDDEYVEHFRDLFFQAVRARLRVAGPVAALLSGGLDSGSVVCTAQELYRQGRAVNHGFGTFSFVFDALECDEREYIAEVQAKYGFPARYLQAEEHTVKLQLAPGGFQEGLETAPREALDAMASAVAATRARVLLTGDIADAYVAGSPIVFDSLLPRGRFKSAWRYWQAYRSLSQETLRQSIVFAGVLPLLPLPAQRAVSAVHTRRSLERRGRRMMPSWMSPALREYAYERHLQLSLAEARGRRYSNPAREEQLHMLYPPEVSRPPAGWALELWRPYADRRLHEFMVAIPPEQHFNPMPIPGAQYSGERYAGAKWLVRRAMAGVLPDVVRTRRSKTVFRGVFERQLREQWPDYEAVFGPRGTSEMAARGYIDAGAFWARLNDYREGRPGPDFAAVQYVVALESWLRLLDLPRPMLVTVPIPNAHAASLAVAG